MKQQCSDLKRTPAAMKYHPPRASRGGQGYAMGLPGAGGGKALGKEPLRYKQDSGLAGSGSSEAEPGFFTLSFCAPSVTVNVLPCPV